MNEQLQGYERQGPLNTRHNSITPDAQLWTNKLITRAGFVSKRVHQTAFSFHGKYVKTVE